MPFNGSGTYTLPAGNPVVNNTVASSTVHNNTNSDIATALSTCIAKDGQSTPTADIPMGGFSLTGLADGAALQESVNVRQLQNNGAITLTSVSGTNTITATVSPVPAAYASGQIFVFEPAANNTGASTINISSLGAKDIYLNNAAIGADVLVSGQPVVIRYNGTQFEIIGKSDFASLNAAVNTFAGNVTVNGALSVADGAALQESVNVRQLQNNGAITLTSVSGTNTITATVSPVPAAYASGQIFVFEPAANNTGASTINISSLGAKDIYLNNAAIGADVLVSGQPVVIRYNGTQFEIIGKSDFASLNAAVNTFAGNVTVNGALSVEGNTTIGNAAGDTITYNCETATVNTSLSFNSGQFLIASGGDISTTGGLTVASASTSATVNLGNSGGSFYSQVIQDAATTGKLRYNSYAASGSAHGHRWEINGTGVIEINSGGDFYPVTDNAEELGKSGNRWSVVYAATGTINTSDMRLKTENGVVLGLDFINKLNPISYKWRIGRNRLKNGIVVPEPGKRRHWGFSAQQVKETLDSLGLDFGCWTVADDGQQGLRYDQFIAPIVKSLQEINERLTILENNSKG